MTRGSHIDFRQLHVVVVHPRDRDGDTLLRYLERLGCQVESQWPPNDRLDPTPDLLFCLIDPQTHKLLGSAAEVPGLAVVGVVDPANAGTLQALRDFGPEAVLHKPFDTPAI